MDVQLKLELWHLVLLLVMFFGCVAGFGKILLDQFEKRLQERHKTDRDDINRVTGAIQNLERDFMNWRAELPINYVRREDYVRGQSVIEAKLDALYSKLEVVQMKGASQ